MHYLKAVSKMAWTKEKAREYSREYRQWCRDHNFCTCCYSEKAIPGKRYCYKCAEKARTRSQNRSPELREKMNEAARNRYQQAKEAGICVRCRKRPADKGKSFCGICRGVIRERSKEKYREEGRLPMSMRGDGYHCAICTKEVEQIGSKLCNACRERNVKLAENMRSYINKDNRNWDKDIERDVREIEKKRHDGAC